VKLRVAVRSTTGAPNKGPRSRLGLGKLKLMSSSRLAMVARELGTSVAFSAYFNFSACHGGEGELGLRVILFFGSLMLVLFMVLEVLCLARAGHHGGGSESSS
jgi:hypothetical protein